MAHADAYHIAVRLEPLRIAVADPGPQTQSLSKWEGAARLQSTWSREASVPHRHRRRGVEITGNLVIL